MEKFTIAVLQNLEDIRQDYAIANAWAETNFTDEEFYCIYEEGVLLYNSIVDTFWDYSECRLVNKIELPAESDNTAAGSIEQFLEFAKKRKGDRRSKEWDCLTLMVGEGHAISNARHTIKTCEAKEIEIIAGPYMVREAPQTEMQEGAPEWKGYINDYLEELLENRQVSSKVYRNKYVPFHKMFLGMFHFYLRGDCFLVERVHQYGEDQSRPKIILQDEGLARRLKEFFVHYLKFTTKNEQEFCTDFCTHSKSLFNRLYTNEFVEEIKYDYGNAFR